MEFAHRIDSLQEHLLLAKPRNVFGYAVRYFRDEVDVIAPVVGDSTIALASQVDIAEAHALQLLPFLILNPQEFKNTACTIYCHNIGKDTSYKNNLDGRQVMNIIQKINLESFGLKVNSIDKASEERIAALKQIDFTLFVSCVRFPLSCYQLAIWIHDQLAIAHLIMKRSQQYGSETRSGNGSNGASTESSLPLIPLELHIVKQFVQKVIANNYQVATSSRVNGAVSSTSSSSGDGGRSQSDLLSAFAIASLASCNYHMHTHFGKKEAEGGAPVAGATSSTGSTGGAVADADAAAGGEEQQRLWWQILQSTIDAMIAKGSPNSSSSDVIIDNFMVAYFTKLSKS